MQGAAVLLQQHEHQLHASRTTLAECQSAAPRILHKQQSQPFITSEAHAALLSSAELVCRLAKEAQAADQQHGYSSKAPAWKQAQDALCLAAVQSESLCCVLRSTQDSSMLAASMQTTGEPGREDESLQALSQRWEVMVESLVRGVLVWAQNVRGNDEEAPPEGGMPVQDACPSVSSASNPHAHELRYYAMLLLLLLRMCLVDGGACACCSLSQAMCMRLLEPLQLCMH